MTLKQKINMRIERIKNYKAQVAYYRDVQKQFDQAKEAITALVDEDKVDDTYACIKNYFTSLKDLNVFDTGDEMYMETKKCHRFHEKPCRIFNCPFNEKNIRFRNCQLLLNQAQNAKQAAWRMVFQRIK